MGWSRTHWSECHRSKVFAELDMLDLERTLVFGSCVAETLKRQPAATTIAASLLAPSHEGGVKAEEPVRVGPLPG